MSFLKARPLDPEVEDRILARMAAGERLVDICRDRGMPSRDVVYANRKADPAFAERFEAAKQLGCDALAEEIIGFVDKAPERTAKGLVDNGYVGWTRLRMDARLKLLPHWDRRYAAKMDLGNREGEALKTEGNIDSAALTVAVAKAMRVAKLAETDNGA